MGHDIDSPRRPQPPQPAARLLAMREWAKRQRARDWNALPQEAFDTGGTHLSPEQVKRCLAELERWGRERRQFVSEEGWETFEEECREALREKPPPFGAEWLRWRAAA
jgi:hypothetical protein